MTTYARTVTVLLGLAALLAASGACGGEDAGVVHQTFTINGAADPASCGRVDATQIRSVALDPFGVIRGTSFVPCTSFESSLQLNPGTYSVAATFLGADGRAVSRTLTRDGVTVVEGETTTYTVDFPLSTFLPLD